MKTEFMFSALSDEEKVSLEVTATQQAYLKAGKGYKQNMIALVRQNWDAVLAPAIAALAKKDRFRGVRLCGLRDALTDYIFYFSSEGGLPLLGDDQTSTSEPPAAFAVKVKKR